MLSKKNRLVKKEDFKKIYKRSPKIRGRYLSARLLSNNLSVSRFGFVVSNKTIPLATQRNQQKRQLRELVRVRLDRIKPGYDVILKIERSLNALRSGKLGSEIEIILEKARLLV